MVITPSSSSSSCGSFGSFDSDAAAAAAVKPSSSTPAVSATVKFLCSYGGKILPRYPDGKLRYVGGETRVLSIDRSVPFSELQEKMREMCGWGGPVAIRCQLPTEDLDALVSVKSDEDLANVVAEYDRAGRHKVRAFLFLAAASKPSSKSGGGESPTHQISAAEPCVRQISAPSRRPGRVEKAVVAAGDLRYHGRHHHHHLHSHATVTRPCNYLVHHGGY
ncbi:hypothetical protein Cni_G09136 [Canna indica]|uniref:PB1 domain-containing protein n=1 Tax=Canna indica TaxID=4628 RepID=A0AAQ3K1Y0_9LILI|nr:hypothetical protein Cni_G09136 [Canna indica]